MPAAPVVRRSGVAFTVVVSVVMVFGACLMALVLMMSSAPSALVVGVVLAAAPVAPLIACFVWLDRYEPEPRSLLLLGLGWGAFVATSSALVLQIVGEFAFQAPRRRSPAPSSRRSRRRRPRGCSSCCCSGSVATSSTASSTASSTPAWSASGSPSPRTSSTSRRRTSAATASRRHRRRGHAVRDPGGVQPVRAPAVHRVHRHRHRDRGRQPQAGRSGSSRRWSATCSRSAPTPRGTARCSSAAARRFVLTYLFVMVPGVPPDRGLRDLGPSPGGPGAHRGAHRLRPARVHRPRRDPVAGAAPGPPGGPPPRPGRRRARGHGRRWRRTSSRRSSSASCTAVTSAARAPRTSPSAGSSFVDAMRQLRPGVVWPSTAGRNAAAVAFPAGGGQ